MTLVCRHCGLTSFRTSHFRFRSSDLFRLLVLRMPIRCLNCRERAFTSLRQFLRLRNARKASHTETRRPT
jgi:hypothetical protein